MGRGRASPSLRPRRLLVEASEYSRDPTLPQDARRQVWATQYTPMADARYPDACRALKLEHRLHSPYEKSLVERANEYIKDRIEEFDDYWPCSKGDCCDLKHVWKWLNLFVDVHYARRTHMTFRQLTRFLEVTLTLHDHCQSRRLLMRITAINRTKRLLY
jgi:hypothetical protein